MFIDDGLGCCQNGFKLQEMASYFNQVFEVKIKRVDCHVGLHIHCNQ
jgi:hypothetical protein